MEEKIGRSKRRIGREGGEEEVEKYEEKEKTMRKDVGKVKTKR